MKTNKTLASYAEFCLEIELEEYRNPTNLQYYSVSENRWVDAATLNNVTYNNYVDDRIRIKPKPKMRAMTAHEIFNEIPCEIMLNGERYIIGDVGISYVNVYGIAMAKVYTWDIDYFTTYATRLDGSKFEVEVTDENE
jgi:hypothetical protein